MRRLLSFAVVFLAAALSGCGTFMLMPLSEDAPQREATKPLYLMSVVVKNEYKPRWAPQVLDVVLSKNSGAEKPETTAFRMDTLGTVEPETEDGLTTYLVRYTAEPEEHTVVGFNSMAFAFPFTGGYFVPLHAAVPKGAPGVYYLGAIRAVLRERQEGEFRAGSVIPLIDQAAAGASSGTFDVTVSDHYEHDVALFKKRFAALDGLDVKKAVLPAWDRAKAQLYWEKN